MALLLPFSLPPFIVGVHFFLVWIKIHTSLVYYIEYPYLGAGSVWVLIGAVAATSALYGAARRSFFGLLFVGPIVLGLGSMISIPDLLPFPSADTNYLSSIHAFFRVWYESNSQRFPATVAEFQDALDKGPAAWQFRVEKPPSDSPYSRNEQRLPYQIVIANDASGPTMTNASGRPGIIYYSVSNDRQRYWVTVSGFRGETAFSAPLKDNYDGQVLVYTDTGHLVP